MKALLLGVSAGVLLLGASQIPALADDSPSQGSSSTVGALPGDLAPQLAYMQNGQVSVTQAVRVLRMATGLEKPSATDVAALDLYPAPFKQAWQPLSSMPVAGSFVAQGHTAMGDGQLTAGDAVQVLTRAMGISFLDAAPVMRVKTIAGGSFGFADGPAEVSRFNGPVGVAVDADGILYVADRDNYRVRKVLKDGTVVTLAGSGTAGAVDGIGDAAQFQRLSGIAVAPSGDIYVTDNHKLRRVSQNGNVVTVAGNTQGFAEGVGNAALFNDPRGLAVDQYGYIYVADCGNNRIRRVTPGYTVDTLAGNNTAAFLSAPTAVAVDTASNVYIVDMKYNRIRKFSPDGIFITLAGATTAEFADGTGDTARFYAPQGLAMDANGNLYVADAGNNRIRLVLPNGEVKTIAGQTGAGYADDVVGSAAKLSFPSGVAVDSSGVVYFTDQANHRLRRLTAAQ
ncbi:MAG TPA: NHL repeat-containing protein [Armatimonadota bacterium]|jgi:sugar lactone lactonase YvrE